MVPVAAPLLADSAAVTVKAALAAHLLKSMVTFAFAVACGAMLPTSSGKDAGLVMMGVHEVPFVWAKVMLTISAPSAEPGPLLPTWRIQTRALAGPDLPAVRPPSEVAPGTEFVS